VFGVAGSVEEGGGAAGDGLFEEGELWGEVFELGLVAGFELGPLGGVVGEPLAEFVAGGDFFEPEVDAGFLLGEAAGPEAVDEDAGAVGGGGFIVDALDLQLHGRIDAKWNGDGYGHPNGASKFSYTDGSPVNQDERAKILESESDDRDEGGGGFCGEE
jgi:hypothetical protein